MGRRDIDPVGVRALGNPLHQLVKGQLSFFNESRDLLRVFLVLGLRWSP